MRPETEDRDMTSAEIAARMIVYSKGGLHDIDHFLKVFAYAQIIGRSEGLGEREQLTLETAALLHDIACPLCREKYGNTNGKYQELEGGPLAREFLRGSGLPDEVTDRVVFLVAHHHSYASVDGPDYQILLEADYLVNAEESAFSRENIRSALKTLFKTPTGSELLKSVYAVA